MSEKMEKVEGRKFTDQAIEKIGARVRKDVRTASFGVNQYLDKAHKDIGRLRRHAQRRLSKEYFDAKKLAASGQSATFPGVPAIFQRDKRQMRSHKPAKQSRQEKFK